MSRNLIVCCAIRWALIIGCLSFGACANNALVVEDLGGPADPADLGAPDDLTPAGDFAPADLSAMPDLSPAPTDLAGARLGFSFTPTIGSGTLYTLQLGVYPPFATPVTLSLVSGPGTMTGTLTGTTDATTGTLLLSASFDRAGTYEIQASSPDAASGYTSFRVAGNVHWTVQPGSTTGGVVQNPAPTVTLIDATGAVDTTNHDDVTVYTSHASSCPLVARDWFTVHGVATLSSFAVRTACAGYVLTASTPWSTADSSSFDITVGPPVQLAMKYLGTATPLVNTPLSVRVSIVDAGGNVVTAEPATPIDLSLAGAVLGGTTQATTAGGIATFSNLTVDRAGSFTLNASGGGFSGSLALQVTAWDPRAAVSFAALTVDPTNPDVVYALPRVTAPAALQASSDGAASFAARGMIDFVNADSPILVDAKTPSTLYVPSSFGFFRSDDSGASFAATAAVGLNSELLQPYLVQDSTSGVIYLLDEQFMWRTSDGGASFSEITLPNFQIWTVAVDSSTSTVWVAGGASQVWRSSDGGAHWTERTGNLVTPPATSIARILVSPTNSNNLFVTTQYGTPAAATTDGGTSWTMLPAGPNALGVVVDAGGTWYAPGDVNSNLLWKSADGITWRSVSVPTNLTLFPVPGHAGWLYGVDETDPGRIYRTKSGAE